MSTQAPPATGAEVGYVVPDEDRGLPLGFLGLPGWGTINVDATETVSALKWPASIYVYDRMRSDPQVEALLRGMTLPIRRFKWQIEPDGSKARVHNRLAEDLGLPIAGKKRRRTRRTRFSHDEHLRMALLAPVYGHMFFEQIGSIEVEDGRPFWRLRKLAPRMPHSIEEIKIERDGGLAWIRQKGEWKPPTIGIERLLIYVHEREGANWFGRSLLRAAYQPWLLKDRLLRVDAIRHERNGMGVPIVELPERATPEQKRDAQQMVEQYKAGMASGGVTPNGMQLHLKGVEGQVSDVLASIRYHDEAMARLMLQMFTQLGGGGEYGSKALGDTFVKFFALAQDSMADWYCETFNEFMILDWVNWNFGEDEQPPRLVYERDQDPELSAHEFAQLVAQGVITVDKEMENFIRDRYKLPEFLGERPVSLNVPGGGGGSGDAPPDRDEPNENVRQPPAQRTAS